MATAAIRQSSEFQLCRKLLEDWRQELVERLYQRHREIAVESGPEDEAALALRIVNRDLALSNMERETRTLSEIDLSLKRIDAGQYGICGFATRRSPGLPCRGRACVSIVPVVGSARGQKH
jgi:RNA polymerase-binding transcription factor DksA